MSITKASLQKPTNHKNLIGKPMLFAIMPIAIIKGSKSGAYLTYNIMTGHWFIFGQKGRTTPYVLESFQHALQLLKTVDHYNITGERKAFKGIKTTDLEIR